jgi:hypothetical protein
MSVGARYRLMRVDGNNRRWVAYATTMKRARELAADHTLPGFPIAIELNSSGREIERAEVEGRALAEVMWASYVPLHAPARIGKVHLREPGEWTTLCGVSIPGRSSLDFTVMISDKDARCTRCRRKAGA